MNHSENKIASFEELTKTHMRAKEVGLKTLIFASSLTEFKKILTLKPDFIAYEPEELVGSSEKSVASERPEIITDAFNLSKEQGIPLIVGAGIHSREDIKTSLNLGASGFAVASDILKAHDPKAELLDLIEGYN
ncbi:MAG: Triosephosphate isomerase [candidate division WWE3 bacterium GW2011_GWA1_41_8]|uniref:Triosephosphate isomerase n=1 Tax=candidate division WWE3 bacterium GW2011_GWA1_41_8 TaxID=1619103 RepID=A0A0G0ZES7_UNCKA|nr:MAG: Triosephosphate isomerase [candidate division WWE3 bacterium GW2011_GWA1_41_8]